MKLTLGFSPCPNDTFIFDALVNGKIDARGIEFEVVLEDVQTLNNWAREGRLDLTKISYGVLPEIIKDYWVLKSGGALGRGVGPLLIAASPLPVSQEDPAFSSFDGMEVVDPEIADLVENSMIAVPGEQTTAHFLFKQAFPQAKNKVFMRFDEIENWVKEGKGLGIVIHENRFTYQQKGLFKWADLGNLWEKKTGLPIPLGGIAAKKSLPVELLGSLNSCIKESLSYSWKNYPVLDDFVKNNSQEMEVEIMRKHIDLYVNDFTMDMGNDGMEAVLKMLRVMNGRDYNPVEIFA